MYTALTLMALGVLLVALPLVIMSLRNPKISEAGWFSDSWKYRKKIIISNSLTEQADYVYGFSLGTLTSGQVNSDCSDIRVTDSNSITITDPYWVDCTDSTSPTVWIKFSTLPAGSTVLFVYYGNSSATSTAASASDIFSWSHTFDGTTIDTSKITQGGGSTTQNEYLSLLNNSDAWDTYAYATTTQTRAADLTFQAKYKATSGSMGMIGWHDNGSGVSYTDLVHGIYFNNGTFDAYEDGNDRTGSGSYSQSTWYDVKIVLKATGATFYYKAISSNTWTSIYDSSYSSETPLKPGIVHYDSGEYAYTDNWIVRQQLSTEPTLTVDSEEQAPSPVARWKFDEGFNQDYVSPLTTHEQQINFTDRTYTSYTVAYLPSDNSLGLIKWDADKYPDSTVYFEVDVNIVQRVAICWDGAYVGLYDEAGAQITTITVSCGINRYRSAALNLIDGTNYTARIRHSGETSSTLLAARLVVIQNNSTKLTDTETQIAVGNAESQTSNTATQLTDKKIYTYDSTKFSPAPTAYFEATLKSSQPTIEQQINLLSQNHTVVTTGSFLPDDNSLGLTHWDADKYPDSTVYFEVDANIAQRVTICWDGGHAGLYNEAGTQITTIYLGCGINRSRTAALSLTDDTNYTVRVRNNGENSATLIAARFIVVQTNATKITNTETSIEVGNYQAAFTNTSAVELTDPKIYQYNAGAFSPTVESSGDASFSATLKIDNSADTVYAELYNKTNSTVVATVSHTGDTNWTYKTSTNIDGDSDWDTTNDDEYVVRVYCADGGVDGCSGNISNAKIILTQYAASGITALETLQQQVNTAKTDADSTYTSQNYFNRFNPEYESDQVSFAGGTFTYLYEATIKTSADTGYAQLYNVSDSSAISNSELSTTSTSYVRQRSGNLTGYFPQYPQSYARILDTQIKNSATSTTTVSNTWVIVQISNLATSSTTAYADLYNLTDSTQVTGSEVSITSNNWSLQRSSAITLTTNKEYVVRTKSGTSNVPIYLSNAKIILDQSDPEGIKAVESVYQMVNTVKTDADSTYTSQYYYNYYDQSNTHYYLADKYFESTMKTSAGTGYAQLYNSTGTAAVSGSELTTTSTSYERKRSSNLISAMPSTASNLDTQIKNSATNTTSVSNSWLIVQNDNTIPDITHDTGRNIYHGSMTNSPTWKAEADCRVGKCLSYDGTDDYVVVIDGLGGELDFAASDDFTISAWFKHSQQSSGTDMILAKYNSTAGGYKIYMESDGDITFAIDDDSSWGPEDSVTSTAATYDDNQWHMLTAVKDGTTGIYLYLDGELIGSDTSLTATGTLANSNHLYIGIDGNGSSSPWLGMIDEVKVSRYAQSAAGIKADYNLAAAVLGASSNYSLNENLALHWKFDETTGDTCSGNDACDSSGNGNYGVWWGDTTTTTGKYGNALDFDGTEDRVATSSATNIPNNDLYRVPITISENSGSNLTNYQVQIDITYDSNMKTDFSDLRFTNSSGTELDYWLESKTDATSATVWVEVDSLTASTDTTIYMYYGYSTPISSSDGDNTFGFFDEFSGTEIDTNKWTITNATGWSVIGGELKGTSTTGRITSVDTFSDGVILEAKYRYITNPTNGFMAGGFFLATTNGFGFLNHPGGDWYRNNSSWVGLANVDPSSTNLLLKITPKSSTLVDLTLINYDTDSSLQSLSNASNGVSSEPIVLGERYDDVYTGQAYEAYWDWIFIRKYASTEPSVSLGSEQAYGSDSNTKPLISLSTWVNPDTLDASDRTVISRGSSDSYDWAVYNDSASPGKLKFTSDGVNFGTSTTTLATGSWYHVAMVVDGTQTRLYLNGKLDASVTNNGTLPGTGDISVGADADGTNGWDGKIDDFRIYTVTLGGGEIAKLAGTGGTLPSSPGPVAHWKLDENTGTVAYDTSGNENESSAFSGNVSWTPGRHGSALQFDGDGDYVPVTEGAVIDLGITTDSYTVGGWVKTGYNSSGSQTVIAKDDGSGAYPYSLYLNSSEYACFAISDGTNSPSACGSTALNDGSWHYLTGIRDVLNDKVYIYVDGVQITSTTDSTTATTANDDNITFGNSGTDYTANDLLGSVDDLRIYNYARSAGEIISDMNASHPAPGSPVGSPVLHLKFDEGYGDSAYDSSPQGNNGNLAGTCPGDASCPTWTNSGKIDKALSFDGGDNVKNNIELSSQDAHTYSLWLNPSSFSSTQQPISSCASGANFSKEGIQITSSGKIRYYTFGAGFIYTETNVAILLNNWVHLVAVRNGNEIKIYLNGKLNYTDAFSSSNLFNIDTSYIGSGEATNGNLNEWFTGLIDEVKIYNFALNDDQVAMEYNQGKTAVFGAITTDSDGSTASFSDARKNCPPGDTTATCSPVAEYKFDENTGTSANNSAGGSYTGTVTGASWTNVTGAPKAAKGLGSSALSFNGSSSYVDIGTGPLAVKTIEFWTKPATTTEYFVNLTATSDYIWSDGGTVTATGLTSPSIYINGVRSTSISAGSWQHVVITTDTAENASNLDIGRTQDTNYLQGLIDGVRLYDYALSPSQVVWNYSQGAPVVNYKLDECTGTTLYNSSPAGGNNATIYPASNVNTSAGSCNSDISTEMWNNGTTGKYTSSLDFDGDDDYAATGNSAILASNSTTYTTVSWGAWVKPGTSPASDTIIHKDTEFRLTTDASAYPQCEIYSGSWQTAAATTTALPTGSWSHVLCTYDGANIKLYINGTLKDTQAETDTITSSSSTALNLARDSGSSGYFDGLLDEVKVWNYNLTNQQVMTEYNKGTVRFD